jgi:putative transposase
MVMPRPLRNIVPGVAVHLIQRGNNRAACFRRESDYLLYLLHLRELSARLECAVHAYCLMTNHVHLLVSPSSAEACKRLMKQLGQRYAQYFNRTYSRTGPLWDGRYHSSVAASARYVLGCYRYIELNPVAAGMVNHPTLYTWSSYRANALGKDDRIVSPHAEYLALGLDAVAQRNSYTALFHEAMDRHSLQTFEPPREAATPWGQTPTRTTGSDPDFFGRDNSSWISAASG